jgi:hypothetical protein
MLDTPPAHRGRLLEPMVIHAGSKVNTLIPQWDFVVLEAITADNALAWFQHCGYQAKQLKMP